MEDVTKAEVEPSRLPKKRYFRWGIASLAVIVLLAAGYAGYVYAASPDVVRNPKLEHYHFRMQVVVDGKSEDFSSKAYQTGYAKDQCNANLPEQPIHFHDNKDQFTHIHWEGMTGGMVMKYYGWNYIGGLDKALGYKLDDLKDIQKVTTHGNYLPAVDDGKNFYVFSGDENDYKQRSFDDWKTQDLEKFFGTTSNFPAHDMNQQKTSLMDKLFPKASAHGEVQDEHVDPAIEQLKDGLRPPPAPDAAETAELTRINNLVGNVVVFAQKDKPTDQQIKDRFNDLEPLSTSTCGG